MVERRVPLRPQDWPEAWKRPLRPVRRAVRAAVVGHRTARIARCVARGDDAGLPRRIEIGSGGRPTPGYTHVDVDPFAPDIDLLAPAHALPLPDEWAIRILSVHTLEHVEPRRLRATLAEWHRVLVPGGELEIHTPNAVALGAALADGGASASQFWSAQSAVFGYGLHPTDAFSPDAFSGPPDHTLLFDDHVLDELLTAAGFEAVTNRSGELGCAHHDAWDAIVRGLCLEMTARKPTAS